MNDCCLPSVMECRDEVIIKTSHPRGKSASSKQPQLKEQAFDRALVLIYSEKILKQCHVMRPSQKDLKRRYNRLLFLILFSWKLVLELLLNVKIEKL